MLILAGVAVPLSFASLAYACGVLATVHFNHASTSPGASISAIGGNYSTAKTASLVVLRFNGRAGTVLWSGHPDANGSIHSTFTVPSVGPGYYLIFASQTTATGAPVAGTPGRAVLRIGSPSSARRAAAALWPSNGSGPGASSHSTVANPGVPGRGSGAGTLIALASAVLLAGGVLVLLDDRRRGRHTTAAV
ncbi:MAG TPA: hypothetical protein VG294_17850 [Solirubrobacteraceae bacterium]|jgi:hypothetical protein|nr:hypothetical protein [Solirubrobacteraceae bacterium]